MWVVKWVLEPTKIAHHMQSDIVSRCNVIPCFRFSESNKLWAGRAASSARLATYILFDTLVWAGELVKYIESFQRNDYEPC